MVLLPARFFWFFLMSWWLPLQHLLVYLRLLGNIPSSALSMLPGKVWPFPYQGLKAAIPSKCPSFGLEWQIFSYTLYQYINFLSLVILSFSLFFYHPSIHLPIHQLMHPSIAWGQKRKSSSTVQYMVSMLFMHLPSHSFFFAHLLSPVFVLSTFALPFLHWSINQSAQVSCRHFMGLMLTCTGSESLATPQHYVRNYRNLEVNMSSDG